MKKILFFILMFNVLIAIEVFSQRQYSFYVESYSGIYSDEKLVDSLYAFRVFQNSHNKRVLEDPFNALVRQKRSEFVESRVEEEFGDRTVLEGGITVPPRAISPWGWESVSNSAREEFNESFDFEAERAKFIETIHPDSLNEVSYEEMRKISYSFIDDKIENIRGNETLIFVVNDLIDLPFFEEEIETFLVHLGPNPIKDELRLTILNPGSQNLEKMVEVKIFNSLNREVKSIRFPIINSAIMERRINIDDFSPGVFYITVKIEGELEQRHTFTKTTR